MPHNKIALEEHASTPDGASWLDDSLLSENEKDEVGRTNAARRAHLRPRSRQGQRCGGNILNSMRKDTA